MKTTGLTTGGLGRLERQVWLDRLCVTQSPQKAPNFGANFGAFRAMAPNSEPGSEIRSPVGTLQWLPPWCPTPPLSLGLMPEDMA